MKWKIVGIGFCLLLTLPLLPTAKATDYAEKYTVYMNGRYLTDYDHPHSINYVKLWHLSLFRGNQLGNWINCSFTHKTLITLIINNKLKILQGPVNVYLGLTAPETFMFLWWPPLSLNGIGRGKIFGVCDTLNIFNPTAR